MIRMSHSVKAPEIAMHRFQHWGDRFNVLGLVDTLVQVENALPFMETALDGMKHKGAFEQLHMIDDGVYFFERGVPSLFEADMDVVYSSKGETGAVMQIIRPGSARRPEQMLELDAPNLDEGVASQCEKARLHVGSGENYRLFTVAEIISGLANRRVQRSYNCGSFSYPSSGDAALAAQASVNLLATEQLAREMNRFVRAFCADTIGIKL